MIRLAWLKIRCLGGDIIGQSDALHSAAHLINKQFVKKRRILLGTESHNDKV